MKAPAPPAPPDPEKTAAAQAGMNIDTAQAQQLTNMTNQVTPQGTLTYSRSGENQFTDSQGKLVTIPQYTATTVYSPDQQKLFDLSNQTEAKIGQIGLDQAGKIGDLLGTPVNLNNEETERRLFELRSKRLDPMFARDEAALETKLANQGIARGSAAYSAAMDDFNRGKSDAYNQLLLTGRGQSVQEALAERNQPINEITALLNGSQVSQPNFINTPQSPVAGVDYIGLKNQQYQAQMQAYNQQVASKNAMMGGLFGMIGSGVSMFSDKRLKENIKPVGKLNDGTKIYSYNYKGDDAPQVGVMAQEAEKRHPEAIGEVFGFKTVDYSKIVEGQ